MLPQISDNDDSSNDPLSYEPESHIGQQRVFEGEGSSESNRLLLTLVFVMYFSFLFFGGDVLLIF